MIRETGVQSQVESYERLKKITFVEELSAILRME